MSSLWENIKKTVREGMTVAAEKTEELTKIGKIKVEILRIKNKIEKNFTELGGHVYHMIAEENNPRVASNSKVKNIIEEIKSLEVQLTEKIKELEEVKKKEKVEEEPPKAAVEKEEASSKKETRTEKGES